MILQHVNAFTDGDIGVMRIAFEKVVLPFFGPCFFGGFSFGGFVDSLCLAGTSVPAPAAATPAAPSGGTFGSFLFALAELDAEQLWAEVDLIGNGDEWEAWTSSFYGGGGDEG